MNYLIRLVVFLNAALVASAGDWQELFNGKSLEGWKASEHQATWKVEDGHLKADGPRSHLFYDGPVGDHTFRNFELLAEVQTDPMSNSGVFVHTVFQEKGFPGTGYEIQINNSYKGHARYRELKRTGSLYAVRNVLSASVGDRAWFTLRIKVVGHRIRVWVNEYPTVDYLEPESPVRSAKRAARRLSRGTIALQGHDPQSRVAFRRIAVRLLPDEADPFDEPRAATVGYAVTGDQMDAVHGAYTPFIDFHVHLRGGMTVEKAMDRQAVTGINVGVLKNIGAGWAIETDEQLEDFLDSVDGRPLFAGLQVNDRDWYTKHDPALLKRLDYVLGDTMIMPMPDDDSSPVKLFKPDQFTIENPEAWMKRYVRHNLKVLAEPITILANPTWLPKPVAHLYDELWTDARMKQVIQAALENRVALEINANSGYPKDRFIRLAKAMGAPFAFGSNNFTDKPHDMSRCVQVLERYGLQKKDMYVPSGPEGP